MTRAADTSVEANGAPPRRGRAGAEAASRARGRLVEDAYRRLKREILENRMKPGFRAPEPAIAERLGMSRTPVREALVRLAGEKLVELVPRRGARVLPVSPGDMREIYQVLTALEPEAAADVARARPDKAALAPLERAAEAMADALTRDDREGWAAADDRFHRALLDMTPNRRLAEIVGAMLDQSQRARTVTLALRAPPTASTEEHAALLDAIVAGDADRARTVFSAHRRRAADELIAHLETAARGDGG